MRKLENKDAKTPAKMNAMKLTMNLKPKRTATKK